MLKIADEMTENAVKNLIAHYCELALETVEKLASSYDDIQDEDFALVQAQLTFSKRLRFWDKNENVTTSICVDTRYRDEKGFPKEFSFATTYSNGQVTHGGLINHGTADKPRWSAHT
ncbi:hypothetical protein [Pseudoalteromonas phage KB12-38]|nr:hypothetical protein [Pseudoalteromonas phage KB12-38]